MKIVTSILLVAVAGLAGCTQDVASRDAGKRRAAYIARTDYSKDRRMITGSNIPMPTDHLTFGPVSANTPPESLSRERPSLYPTEPVVGATPNTEPGTAPANVGAGPAGSNPLPGAN